MDTSTAPTNSTDSISPGFLVASPKLDDTPFERAVVVMVNHDEQGAMGFIVNKPLEINFGSVIQSVHDGVDSEILPESYEVSVHFGGPVRVEQLWLMFRRQLVEEENSTANQELKQKLELPGDSAFSFGEEWFLAASGDLIEGFALGEQHGAYRPFIGYCGWGPGQLTGEIEDGSWLLLDFDDEFLLESLPDLQWEDALDRLGVDPTAFLMMGTAGMA